MKSRWKYLAIILGLTWLVAGCTTTTRMASTGSVYDDLYTSHNRKAIAESEAQHAQQVKALREKMALQDIQQAGEDGYYSESILSNSYEDSYARRLKGFSSLEYKMPGSYYDLAYSDAGWEASGYDPAFYNTIVMGDQIWVEPRYITSMFGNWGTPVNINLGWGWDRWYRPYWDWYYPGNFYTWGSPWGWGFGSSWGWDRYWGWGWHNPWWDYPYWGGGIHYPGGGHWGGGSGRPTVGTVGNTSYVSGSRYSGYGRGSSGSNTLSSTSSSGGSRGGSTTISSGNRTYYNNNGVATGNNGTTYRRGSSTPSYGSGSTGSGNNLGTPSGSGTTYRRGSSSSSSGNYGSSSSGTTYRRSGTSSGSSYNSGSSTRSSGSSSSRSSGSSYSGSSYGGGGGSYSGGGGGGGSYSGGGGSSSSSGGGRR